MSVTSRSPSARVRALLGTADLEPLADSELLRRFAATRDDAAFAALVRRHTPLVLGTARRVCPGHADAEDVFQAAFLTLSRKAGSVRCDGSLAPWLHRVTFRLAVRARRTVRPVPALSPPNPGNDPLAVLSGRELCSLIDGEIARLSARLRGPIVLCCLQGRTRDEAAADLGWSVATLKRRLARAREVLEARLRKKGLGVPAALGPAILAIPAGETTGVAKAFAALAAAMCVVGVGIALGLGQAGPPPASKPAAEVVDTPREPLPTGAVARLGTTWFRHDQWVHDAAWSPDGKTIASAAGTTVIVWEAATGREAGRVTLTVERFPPPAAADSALQEVLDGLAWLPDGTGLRTRYHGATQEWAWNGTALKLTSSVPSKPENVVWSDLDLAPFKLVYNADRTVLAACGPSDEDTPKHIEVWAAKPQKRRFRVAFPGDTPKDVRAFALSPDGRWLVTGGGDKVLRWWDTTTGKVVRTVGPGEIYFNRAAFRPDGKVLLTVSHENHVRLWDVETGKELPHPAGLPWGVSGLAVTPDAKTALVISERNLCAFDLTTGQERWRRFGDVDARGRAVVTPDGRTAVASTSGGKVTFWDVATGAKKGQIDNPRESATHLAISPDGRTLAAIGSGAPHDKEIRRWDVETRKPLAMLKLPDRTVLYSNYVLRFTPDGTALAVASGTDLFVPVVDCSTGRVRAEYGKTDGGIDLIDYSRDGRTVAVTSGNSLYLWETATGRERLRCLKIGYVTCFAFSPDGRYVALGNHGTTVYSEDTKRVRMDADKIAVRILDAFTGKEVHRFTGHTGGVRQLVWAADGRWLVSASDDSTCLVWDARAIPPAKPVTSLGAADAANRWDQLAGADATKAYDAVGRLIHSPASAVEQARKHLTPVKPVEAAAVSGPIGRLDSPRFAVREAAAAELAKVGEGAAGYIRAALNGPVSAEARERLEVILAGWADDDRRLVAGRGLEVLERVATPEAKRLLSEFAAGADGAWLTDQARASLNRMGRP
ncbi:MAG TPA: sigma-70 family RNA polymerase sigma factor [Gemmataceae bacterium]|nr:sigma-70 family RNA polymerase sigma factor [Gemmataceae bacterium]